MTRPLSIVSAVDGTGLAELRAALDDVLAQVPAPAAPHGCGSGWIVPSPSPARARW